ncbi:MAG: Fpg/Nei family DNA glycosylase [Acidobacteria bacterium]|nr:Fpg/Nei family DNA glycosylase [Acidobacteriota bacterium]
MPEGDTIFRAARTLHRALAGHPVVRFESVFPALTRVHDDHPLTGQTIESVTAAGKHLLMRFSGGRVLRTHMRMNGSWHIYRRGEPWQRPRRDMRIVVATDTFEAVGFNVPVAEFLDARGMARQEDLRQMGPELLADDFDEDDAVRRFRERGDREIGDALLNQRIVAGAGNVYKSEVLFLCRVNPFARVATIDDDALRRIVGTARKYLRANVTDPRGGIVTYTGYRRTTRRADPGERLYVYGRARQPCRRCGTRIRVKAQGPHARLTYWCPACQNTG